MLKGIFPPVTTPFINNEVAYDKLVGNIKKLNSTDLAGYVVFGSNGESAFLTKEEKIKIISVAKENANPDKVLIAGTGSDSIKETISLSNEAAENGADYVLILTPSFYKSAMKSETFIDYFTKAADAIKIPLIIYNVPKFTGVNIEVDAVAKLSEHRNIIGIKNSSENIAHLSEIIYNTPDSFLILVGTASVLYAGLSVGAVGGVLALANIAPEECLLIQKYFEEGNYKKSLEIQMKMLAVNKAVTATFGVPGLKAAMDMLGYYGGPPRSPLSSLKNDEIEKLRMILEKAGFLE